MKRLCLFTLVGGILLAQAPLQTRPGLIPYQPSYAELKAALNLTDDQLAKLKQLQQDRNNATQAVYAQIAQKQKQLNDLLNANSTDAMAIGTLSIETQRLRSQMTEVSVVSIRDHALALLSPDQKTRLARLQEALNLRQAADQAAGFSLIEYPKSNAVPMMPMGLPAK